MAVREIVPYTDSFIRKKSKPVKVFDDNLWELLDDMRETVKLANGSGLSAVQVGVLKRVFVVCINEVYMEFVNPEILETSGKQIHKEGCLSVKRPFEYVERPQTVTVRAFDRYGNKFTFTCEGWTAVCVCHENDHLDGLLYIDKICIPPKDFVDEDEQE